MEDLLLARVVGYEVCLRMAALLWSKHPEDWYHCTGCAGAVGAAAASARLRGLDADGMYRAIVIAWSHAPDVDLRAADAEGVDRLGSPGGCLGRAARRRPATCGCPRATSHRCPTSCQRHPSTGRASTRNDYVMSYGRVWESGNTYFKPYAACRYTHAAARGLSDMVREHGLTADAIASIEVGTHVGAVFLAEQRPQTLEHAQYSFPHVLAAIVLDGAAGAAEISEERLFDPDRAALADRVTVAHDDALDAEYPAHYGSRLRVTTSDGRVLEGTFLDAPGDAALPHVRSRNSTTNGGATLNLVVSENVADDLLRELGEPSRPLAEVIGPVFDEPIHVRHDAGLGSAVLFITTPVSRRPALLTRRVNPTGMSGN